METRRSGPASEANETPRHRALGTASRAAILRLVSSAGAGLTAADVVDQVRLHPSTVRAHLEQLVDVGLLMKARASDGSPGRPAWRYRAAAAEPSGGVHRLLAAALLEHLATDGGGTRTAIQAGQAWGQRLAATTTGMDPVDATLNVLRDLGFDPQKQRSPGAARSGDAEIHLRTCPFLDLVGPQPDVMCALHAGMLRGVLHGAGAADVQAALEPFAAPNACVVRLSRPRAKGRRP
jgi:predicted ArsR family transcriptional regulator